MLDLIYRMVKSPRRRLLSSLASERIKVLSWDLLWKVRGRKARAQGRIWDDACLWGAGSERGTSCRQDERHEIEESGLTAV